MTAESQQIAFRKNGNHYAATFNGSTLWIRRDHISGSWDVVRPWASTNPDGTFRSERLRSFKMLKQAKGWAAQVLENWEVV